MATVDSILTGLNSSSAVSSSTSSSSSAASSLDKDDFLKLLVAQLEHQDPLNPLDDKEFIAQLAQFSSLEQMNNISSGIDTLNKTVSNQDSLSAANYIGKDVVASGDSIRKVSDSSITPIYFSLDEAVSSLTVSVYDKNKNLVKTENLGSMKAGDFTYTWDGLDYKESKADKGEYSVYFAAKDASGDAVLVDTEVQGTITGISKSDGETYFTLKDGRKVSFDEISSITTPTTTISTTSSTTTSSSS